MNNERNMTVMDWAARNSDSHVPPRDVWRSESAVCTTEERAFLDSVKAGKNLAYAQRAANLAWARRNMPALAAVRGITAERIRLRDEWQAAWARIAEAMPFKGAAILDVYDYCGGSQDTLAEEPA